MSEKVGKGNPVSIPVGSIVEVLRTPHTEKVVPKSIFSSVYVVKAEAINNLHDPEHHIAYTIHTDLTVRLFSGDLKVMELCTSADQLLAAAETDGFSF